MSSAVERRLNEVGTNFGDLLDDVRRRVATDLVVTTDLPMLVMAQQPGYTEQSRPPSNDRTLRGGVQLAPRVHYRISLTHAMVVRPVTTKGIHCRYHTRGVRSG
jgi:hypothetical protein